MRPDSGSISGLQHLVDYVLSKDGSPSTLNMVEIGSYAGQSMQIFLETGKINSITCIDTWVSGYDNNDIASQTDMKLVESEFDRRMESFRKVAKIIKYKGTLSSFVHSDLFNQLIKPVHFVYIDADHRYDGCKNDVLICLDVLKPLIAICGHDYYTNGSWPGVRKAVDEAFEKPDKVFEDSSWCKFI